MIWIRHCALLVAVLLAGCASPGLLRSEDAIRASLLKLTPMGSTPERVLEVAKSEGWKHVVYDPRHGFFVPEGLAVTKGKVVGVSGVSAVLGTYPYFPLGSTWVSADWGFDEQKRLIEIRVKKTVDSL